MSKLINAVKAVQTGRRFPDRERFPTRLIDVVEQSRELVTNVTYEYDVRVDLHTRTRGHFGAGEDVQKRACEYLAFHVFGEFKEHIVEARHAIHDGDTAGALQWLDEMEKRMFEV